MVLRGQLYWRSVKWARPRNEQQVLNVTYDSWMSVVILLALTKVLLGAFKYLL